MLLLWRTNMLRQTKPASVIDEVTNGLSYYDYTFFRELPRLYGAVEGRARPRGQAPKTDGSRAPRLLPARRLMLIGGDRDGNPFVTAEVLKEAMRLQSAAALQPIISKSCTSLAASFL